MSLTLSLTNSTTFSSVQTPISLALPLISSTSCHSNLITTDQISRWNNEEVIEWISNVQQGLFAQYSFKLQTLNINGEELLNLSIPFMMNELEIKNANHRLTLEAQINRLKNKGYKRKSFKYDSMLPIALPLHSHSKSLGPVTIHSIADSSLSLNHSYSNDVNTHKCKNGNISENKKNKKNKKSKKSRKKWKKMKKMKKNKKNKKLKTVESKVQKTSTIKPSSLSVYYKNESNSNNIQSEMSATQILEQSNTSPGSYEENQWGVSIPDVKKKKKKYYYKELAKQLVCILSSSYYFSIVYCFVCWTVAKRNSSDCKRRMAEEKG